MHKRGGQPVGEYAHGWPGGRGGHIRIATARLSRTSRLLVGWPVNVVSRPFPW
jgi:hypothetical protein